MRKSRFTEEQIAYAMRPGEAGVVIAGKGGFGILVHAQDWVREVEKSTRRRKVEPSR